MPTNQVIYHQKYTNEKRNIHSKNALRHVRILRYGIC